MTTHIAPQNSNIASTLFRTSGKLALSGAYLAGGLSLITLGVCSSVYTFKKSVQFYTAPMPNPMEKPSSFISGFSTPPPPFPSQGFGANFNTGCESITSWLKLSSGPEICKDLSTRNWSQISSPESIAAAIGTTILGTGAVFVLSSYAVMAGISLLGKSFNTFSEIL